MTKPWEVDWEKGETQASVKPWEKDWGNDPTTGMSTWDKVVAGIGSGLTDVKQGIDQRLTEVAGLWEDPAIVGKAKERIGREVKEKRALDAPLKNTTAGHIGNVVGQALPFIPLGMAFPGSATMAGQALAGAGIGGVQGLLTPTGDNESPLTNMGIGTIGGGVAGVGGHFLGNVIRPTAGVKQPDLFQKAKDMGYKIRIGDQTESVNLRNIEDVMRFLPLTGGKEIAFDDANIKILNKTLAKAMGVNPVALEKTGGRITKEIIKQTDQDIGRKFAFLSRNTTLDMTKPSVLQHIAEANRNYMVIDPMLRAKMPEVTLWQNIIGDWMSRGTIDGATYKANRTMLNDAVRSLYRNNESGKARILDELLKAMDAAAPDTQAWKNLRKQAAVYKMVEENPHLIDAGGDTAAKQLNKSLSKYNKKMFATGKFQELGDAAQVADAYLHNPNSATAMRSFWMNALTNPLFLGGAQMAAGGGVGGMSGGAWDWERAAKGAAIGLVGPSALQGLLHSPAGQMYLRNGLLGAAGEQVAPYVSKMVTPLSIAEFMQTEQ